MACCYQAIIEVAGRMCRSVYKSCLLAAANACTCNQPQPFRPVTLCHYCRPSWAQNESWKGLKRPAVTVLTESGSSKRCQSWGHQSRPGNAVHLMRPCCDSKADHHQHQHQLLPSSVIAKAVEGIAAHELLQHSPSSARLSPSIFFPM